MERKGGDLEDAQVAAFHRSVSCAAMGPWDEGPGCAGEERAEFRWGQVEFQGLKDSPEFIALTRRGGWCPWASSDVR